MASTLKAIASRVGLSVTTVSQVLGGYNDVADESRQRIWSYPTRLTAKLNDKDIVAL